MIKIARNGSGKLSRGFLISNDPVYTIRLNSIFEELWKNGIDAEDRIRDIEVGAESANVEVIQISSRPRPIVKSHEVRVVLTALADNEMMKILDSAMNQSKSTNEILKETNISHTTGFRNIVVSKLDGKVSMFVGIDLHKNYLQIAVMNNEGRVLRNSKIDNNLKQMIKLNK